MKTFKIFAKTYLSYLWVLIVDETYHLSRRENQDKRFEHESR